MGRLLGERSGGLRLGARPWRRPGGRGAPVWLIGRGKVVGESVLPDSEVDWLGEGPVIGDGEATMLVFVTPNDPVCGKVLAVVLRQSRPWNGRSMKTVVIFDSTLSLPKTRQYAKERGVAGFAARVKKVSGHGRGSALFKRFGVESLPMDVAVDCSGSIVPDVHLDKAAPTGPQRLWRRD